MIDPGDSKGITIIGVLQVMLIVIGTLVVFGWSKFHGYQEGHPWFSDYVHFIRRYGWGFLIIPVVWTPIAVRIWNRDSPSWQESLVGVTAALTIAALLVLYSYAVATGYRVPLLQSVPASSDGQRHEPNEGDRQDSSQGGIGLHRQAEVGVANRGWG